MLNLTLHIVTNYTQACRRQSHRRCPNSARHSPTSCCRRQVVEGEDGLPPSSRTVMVVPIR